MLFLFVTCSLKPFLFHGIKSFPYLDGSDLYNRSPILNLIVQPVLVLFGPMDHGANLNAVCVPVS